MCCVRMVCGLFVLGVMVVLTVVYLACYCNSNLSFIFNFNLVGFTINGFVLISCVAFNWFADFVVLFTL